MKYDSKGPVQNKCMGSIFERYKIAESHRNGGKMNICRPIILHNEFLPACTGERIWEYRAFGHYDGITVKESILVEKYENLRTLFDIGLKNEEDSFMHFSQTLLGFHEDTKEEKLFWKSELPFLYIVLLQVADARMAEHQKYLESREFLQQELSGAGPKDEIENTWITVYHSLDNSDLIVAIKCGYANTGARLINGLHRSDRSGGIIRIRNSYSILGIDRKQIENPDSLIEANEPIDEMELRVIEGDNHSIGALYHRLEEELGDLKNSTDICVKTLLGAEDESITIRNLPWKRLLPLYREKTGILNNSSKRAQDYAYAISTKIMLPFHEPEKREDKKTEAPENVRKYFCVWLNDKINHIYSDKNGAGQFAEKKNLVMFAKSLFRFENAYYIRKEFSDYNFFALYLPFYTFVELLGEKNRAYPEDYYDFMESLRLRTQSFTKSDRVFSQITDFNMRYFDVPIKFITIYSAYIHYFKQALNTKNEKNYEFLVCPGMNSQIGVTELFLKVSDKRRLFFIEIPEQQMYNLKQTFITIGHEIAHFVGTDVRCRSERKTCMVRLCSRIIVLSMKNYLENDDSFVRDHADDLDFEKVESKLCEWLAFFIEREQNEEYLRKKKYYPSITDSMVKKNLEYKKDYGEHADVLRETLISSTVELLIEHGQDIFDYIFHREFYEKEECRYEEREDFLTEKRNLLQKYIHSFTNNVNPKNQALTIASAVDKIIYLLKECYADMICILTLRLSMKDYLETLTEIIDESNIPIEELADTELSARIAIVMTVVSHSFENDSESNEPLFLWTEKEFDYEASEESHIRKLEKAGNMFAHNYIARKIRIHPDNIIGKSVGLIYDQKILYEIITYLLECRKKYYEFWTDHKTESIMKKSHCVRDIYALSQEQESGEFFGKLMDIVFRYEDDIYAKMQKIMVSEK